MKCKDTDIIISSEEAKAQYFLNQNFSIVPIDAFDEYEILYPDNEYYVKGFIGTLSAEDIAYLKERGIIDENGEFDIDELMKLEEFDEYVTQEQINTEPMWGYIFIDRNEITKTYKEEIYDTNLGILYIPKIDVNAIFVPVAGYDFYKAHWIPLFKKIGWINN